MSIRFVLGFLIGFMLGASVALALAPQPGADTRHQVWEKVKERSQRNGGEA